jgi:hypothetical protein
MGITELSDYTIGMTAVKIADNDPSRKVIFIRNNSTAGQIVSIAFSNTQPPVNGRGIVIGPAQAITDSDNEGYECWEGQIWAISSAAGAAVSVFIR